MQQAHKGLVQFKHPPFAPLPLTPNPSLPARGQNRLHLLRLLIDRLIPGEACLSSEPSHRLDQLIDLRAEQRLATTGLDRLRPIGRADIPVLHRDLIGGTMNRQPQIVGLATEYEIEWVDSGIVKELVRCPTVVLHQILPVATTEQECVVAAAAVCRIVPQALTERIVPVGAVEDVGGIVPRKEVVEGVPRSVECCGAGQHEILDVGRQRNSDRALDLIDPIIGQLDDEISVSGERCQQLPCDLGMGCLHLTPGSPMFQHRIDNRQQLAHTGGECHLLCLSRSLQALISCGVRSSGVRPEYGLIANLPALFTELPQVLQSNLYHSGLPLVFRFSVSATAYPTGQPRLAGGADATAPAPPHSWIHG